MFEGPLIEQAVALFQRARHAVALTGAGVSTPSGIPDFRSPASGLWDRVDPLEVASLSGFKRHPEAFYEWVQPLAYLALHAAPNPAHYALAHLEQYGPLHSVITQNVDTLHWRAGSRHVYEIHGNFRQATCLRCRRQFPGDDLVAQFRADGRAPRCPACGGILKPNVVLFGEELPMGVILGAESEARACDLMLVAGSSLEVAPAGDLPLVARRAGARLIIVNLTPTIMDRQADVVIHGDVAEVLPRLAAPFLPPR